MPNHDFGIIDKFNPTTNKYEEYTPEKYDCVSIHDDFILPLCEMFYEMDTFYHTGKRPEKGLAYHGVTLIPSDSLEIFKKIIETSPSADKMEKLTRKIEKAISENKCIIHYGV